MSETLERKRIKSHGELVEALANSPLLINNDNELGARDFVRYVRKPHMNGEWRYPSMVIVFPNGKKAIIDVRGFWPFRSYTIDFRHSYEGSMRYFKNQQQLYDYMCDISGDKK